MTAIDNDLLNRLLGAVDDKEYEIKGLSETGKSLPYVGWYWRNVEFEDTFVLADCGSFIGFCQSNKWGYEQWRVTEKQRAAIRALAVDLVTSPSKEKAQAFFDYIQTCKPSEVES